MSQRVIDTRISRYQAGLWGLTLVVFGLVAFVTWRYVGTFVLGLFLYYVTRPVHARIATRVHSRTLSVTLALVSVAIPVTALVLWALSVAFRGLRTVLGTDPQVPAIAGFETLPSVSNIVVVVETSAREFATDPSGLLDDGVGQGLLGFVDAISGSLALVVNGGLHLFIALVLLFFLLRDDYRLAAWARSVFVADGSAVETFFEAVDRDLTQVYFGNILNAVITAGLGAVTYVLLNLVAPEAVRIPEPALFGLLAGVASLIPVIGIKLVWIPIALYLLVTAVLTDPTAMWFVALFVVVSVVVVDTLPDQLLRPYVSGRSLHVGAVMLAYTIGPLLFGWYGVFLGPLLLIVVVEGARHVVPAAVRGNSEPSEQSTAIPAVVPGGTHDTRSGDPSTGGPSTGDDSSETDEPVNERPVDNVPPDSDRGRLPKDASFDSDRSDASDDPDGSTPAS